jgi:hypothetical protein
MWCFRRFLERHQGPDTCFQIITAGLGSSVRVSSKSIGLSIGLSTVAGVSGKS